MRGGIGRSFIYHGGGKLKTAFSEGTDASSITGLTPTQVLFGDAVGGIGQSANLIWNATGLGIGGAATTQKLEVLPVAAAAIIGRVAIGNWGAFGHIAAQAVFAHTSVVSDIGSYALLQFNDGKTALNAAADKTITLKIDGATKCTLLPNGNFGIAIGTPSELLEVGGNVLISSNTDSLILGATKDMKVYYDGTNGNIDTDLITPSDLIIDCGANKTLELEVPVYKDINIGGVNLTTAASNQPSKITISTTSIITYAFDGVSLAEELSGAFELQHDYKEGTDIVPHVHWYPVNANAGNVKWWLQYWIRLNNTLLSSATIIVVQAAGGVAWAEQRADFPAINGATFPIGAQIHFRLHRIANDAQDTYGSDAALGTFGIHYQLNTLGSRQIILK